MLVPTTAGLRPNTASAISFGVPLPSECRRRHLGDLRPARIPSVRAPIDRPIPLSVSGATFAIPNSVVAKGSEGNSFWIIGRQDWSALW